MKLNEIKQNKSQFFTTREEVENWLNKWQIENYTINADLTVDVNGTVYFENSGFEYFPVKFGTVNGHFTCEGNNQLKSLVGAPERVTDGGFDCSYCTSLTSLEGCPRQIAEDFYIIGCAELTSLEFSPEQIGGNFDCSVCTKLVNLKGATRHVSGGFVCDRCNITSLEGAPDYVGKSFFIRDCAEVTSFNHLPREIARSLHAQGCPKITNYLYLLKIKSLRSLVLERQKKSLERVIDKYLPEGDIFECQQELMDAGLDEYAEL